MKRSWARSRAAALGAGLTAALLAPGVSAAEPAGGVDAPARLLEQLAQAAHGERLTRSWLSLGSGAALTAAGLFDEADGDAGFGRVVWIAGLLSITGGTLGLLVPSPLEKLQREAGSGSAGYSPGALEAAWRARADDTRAARHIVGVVNLVLGGAGLAASGALLGGLSDWSERRRQSWAVQFFAAGALFSTAGVTALLIPSEAEKGYDLAYPARASASLSLQIAPARGGATLQLCGSF
jgi:hypothetical protein